MRQRLVIERRAPLATTFEAAVRLQLGDGGAPRDGLRYQRPLGAWRWTGRVAACAYPVALSLVEVLEGPGPLATSELRFRLEPRADEGTLVLVDWRVRGLGLGRVAPCLWWPRLRADVLTRLSELAGEPR